MINTRIASNLFLNWLALPILLLAFCYMGCAPKPVEETPENEQEETATQTDDEWIETCATFESIPRGQMYLESYVIYRDFLKSGDMQEAFNHWESVYENTPAADGQRWTVYSDGIRFYEWMKSNEENEEKKDEYARKIMGFYDEIGYCYPDQTAFMRGRKAFELYYNYRELASNEEIFSLFQSTFEEMGEEVPAFVINPFTALMIGQFSEGRIDTLEAKNYAEKILEIVDLHSDSEDDSWSIVSTYTPQRLADLESVEGFYSCDYYLNNYLDLYRQNPEECESIQLALSKLTWGGCPENLEIIKELRQAVDDHCIIPTTASSLVREAYQALRDGKFRTAIQKFDRALGEETDNERRASYALTIGKIYYSHIRDFPKGREYAQKASGYRSNWGEPYILIGKLYASSGPLCGPGTGWDSQVVTWVAIDAWERAKQLDGRVANEADQLINTYSSYMPSREDIFQRNLNVGTEYFVPCWIQRSTTVRASR